MNIRHLEIHKFRGLTEVALKDLATINILTGDNSAGKTAVLEAVFLLFASRYDALPHLPSAFRGVQQRNDDFENFWLWLLPNKDKSQKLEVAARCENKQFYYLKGEYETNSLKLTYGNPLTAQVYVGGRQSGSLPGSWPKALHVNLNQINPIADADTYNTIVLKGGGEDRVLELMRKLDSRIKRIRYLKVTANPLVYIDIGLSNFVPVSQMGQAFERVFSLYVKLLDSKADIILLDEIENGIHPQKMDEVWQGLATLATQENIQLIATTHSKECLKSAFTAVENKDQISSKRYHFTLNDGTVGIQGSDSLLDTGF